MGENGGGEEGGEHLGVAWPSVGKALTHAHTRSTGNFGFPGLILSQPPILHSLVAHKGPADLQQISQTRGARRPRNEQSRNAPARHATEEPQCQGPLARLLRLPPHTHMQRGSLTCNMHPRTVDHDSKRAPSRRGARMRAEFHEMTLTRVNSCGNARPSPCKRENSRMWAELRVVARTSAK